MIDRQDNECTGIERPGRRRACATRDRGLVVEDLLIEDVSIAGMSRVR
jgi:mycofactocin precursor